jgi:hypothetical protein
MYKNYKIYEDQNDRVKMYSNILDSYWPYRFFATLSFQYPLGDKQGIAFASQLVRRLNKKLLGKHWKSNEDIKCLTGAATLEHASIRKVVGDDVKRRPCRDLGSCHFHFLLHDHPRLDRDPNIALDQMTAAWGKAARSLNYTQTRKLVSVNGTNVQLFQTKGLYGYVLKEAKNPDWKNNERLFLMDSEGLVPIDLHAYSMSTLYR